MGNRAEGEPQKAPQDKADVVPLGRARGAKTGATDGGNTRGPKVEVEWSPNDQDPAVYRRLLELLFMPRQQQERDEAA